MKKTLLILGSVFLTSTLFANGIIFCAKSYPQWTQGFGDKMVSSGFGPAIIINTQGSPLLGDLFVSRPILK
jgi:hypothetical protein